ncbi:glycosyltransferase [Fundidesulfovibrio agrisoli]|uniref:glycosyltransferase family protein n=1 Tax=Fundidesulfovibrio agrisoli TaxID=2922717 RepID=UPI001FAB38A6|nr:glycosyltransferase [Fundidesulfovibrio agrisoli]
MRILCIDGHFFLRAFRELGHEVLGIGPSCLMDVPVDRVLSLKDLHDILDARGFTPDAVLWADTCKPPLVAGLETLPWPTLAYSIDQYLNPWHQSYSAGFDAVFVAQKDYLPMFQAEHPRPAVWLPLFCDPSVLAGLEQGERDIPVAFVGTPDPGANPARRPFLEAFERLVPLARVCGEYAPVFARSRLVLNQSAAGELNFRVFEAMCCGAVVLTEDIGNGLRELFTPGEDLLLYPRGDAPAAANAALAALAGDKLEGIARSGREKALRRHTVEARAKTILAWAARLAAQGAPARRLRDIASVRARMANAYAILALDEHLPLTPEHRQFYLELAGSNLG